MTLDSAGPSETSSPAPASAPASPAATSSTSTPTSTPASTPSAASLASNEFNSAADLPAPSHFGGQETEAKTAEEALIKGIPLAKDAASLGASAAQTARVRNEKGEFVAAPKPPAPGTPSEASPAGTPVASAQPAGTPTSKPVTFGGRQFPNMAAAEADYKAHVARVPAEQRRNAQLTTVVAQQEKIIEQLKAMVQGKQPQPATPNAPAPVQAASGAEEAFSVNPQEFELLVKSIGLPATIAYFNEKSTEHTNARIAKLQETFEAKLNESLEPFRQSQTAQAFVNHGKSLFRRAMAATTPQGTALFPEMRDPAVARQIGEIWMDLDPDYRDAEDGRGLFAAISMYRTLRQIENGGSAVSPSSPPAAAVPSNAGVALDAAAAAAAGTNLDASTPVAPAIPTPGAGNAQSAFLRAMVTKNRSQVGDVNLGFDVGS